MFNFVKSTVTVEGDNYNKTRNKMLIFKNQAPLRSCISQIYNKFVDNVEELDIFMSVYNLLEYSDNYSMTSGSLWNYYRDEVNDAANENDNANNKINNNETIEVNLLNIRQKQQEEYQIKILINQTQMLLCH